MNMLSMIKQAQNLQKEMLKTKQEIDETIFTAQSGFVNIKVNGKKELLEIKISEEKIEDVEMLEAMITVSINEAFNKVDEETESKMSKFTNSIPGLF